MPRKYVPKTKKARRPPRRRNYRKRNLLSFAKAPMPNKFATKLRYADGYSINPPPGGLIGSQIIVANGLYDPDYTGTGHQPRGFDQLIAMYDHYTVIGAKITATFVGNGGTSPGGPIVVGIALKDAASPPTNKNEYMEGRNVISRVMRHSSSDASVQDKITLSKAFSAKKFLGVSKPLSSSILRGSAAANPAEEAFFHLFVQVLRGTDDVGEIEVQIVIDYLVVFTEPKQPSQS